MSQPVEVLCIEDNETDQFLLKTFLELDGKKCRMNFAADGIEAMDYLHRRGKFASAVAPDFIILDLNLPKKDGHEVLREIKGDERLRTTPVIVFTNSKRNSDIEACYASLANSYVPKPSNVDELDFALARIREFWVQTAAFASAARI